MAGRIRSLRPEILDDEVLASLSSDAWRIVVSLLVLADDFGCVRFAPKYVAANVFQDTGRDVVTAMLELVDGDILKPYVVAGQSYAKILGWQEEDGRFRQRLDNASKRTRVPSHEKADAVWVREVAPDPAESRGDSRLARARSDHRSRSRSPITEPDRQAAPPETADVAGAHAPASAPRTFKLEEPTTKKASKGEEAREVFEYFVTGRRAAGIAATPPKFSVWQAVIAQRLKTYRAQELERACDSLWASVWMLENKRTSPKYVFGDDKRVQTRLDEAPPEAAPPRAWDLTSDGVPPSGWSGPIVRTRRCDLQAPPEPAVRITEDRLADIRAGRWREDADENFESGIAQILKPEPTAEEQQRAYDADMARRKEALVKLRAEAAAERQQAALTGTDGGG